VTGAGRQGEGKAGERTGKQGRRGKGEGGRGVEGSMGGAPIGAGGHDRGMGYGEG